MQTDREVTPWYRRARRWGQTNLTEIDPRRYDETWWRAYWRATRVQGVIVNAGGIVFYYPSKFPEVHRALYLGERDLFGEIVAAAHDEGLAVLARMDSNRVHEAFFNEHPDWCAVDADGRAYRAGDLYITCINSPYYREFLPDVFREIIGKYRPEGFTDNSYSGLERHQICYCGYCAKSFRDQTGHDLPRKVDWDSPVYRRWIEWSYQCRLDLWDLNNRVTQGAGGKDCLWVGMIHGDMINQSRRLRDVKAICERAQIVMLDWQTRRSTLGFQNNGETGKLLHGLLGWDKLIPESMAMYQAGEPTARLASKPEPEARLWAFEGFAGGIQPWWHHISAYQEDRRQYKTTQPIFRWHEENEAYLFDRRPIATVGVVWSQRNIDFYGRDDANFRVELPWRGWSQALIRSRIPYLPIHADSIEEQGDALSALILPNVGALTDNQCQSIRRFVERGGALIASGESSLYDEWGDPRPDFALADLFGAHATRVYHGPSDTDRRDWERGNHHSYVRLFPELRARVPGPITGDEPPATEERHPVLDGFDETDILPFGGRLEVVEANQRSKALMHFVPHFPVYPPETAWMRQPTSRLPALLLSEGENRGPVAYLAADFDRRYAASNFPDHGRLLANLVRWATGGKIPLVVEGPGFLDCHMYAQPKRVIVHVVNLSHAEAWRPTIHELIPVGPIRVRVQLPDDVSGASARLVVSKRIAPMEVHERWAIFEIPSIVDHEVVVVE